jgi:hypothetical protein
MVKEPVAATFAAALPLNPPTNKLEITAVWGTPYLKYLGIILHTLIAESIQPKPSAKPASIRNIVTHVIPTCGRRPKIPWVISIVVVEIILGIETTPPNTPKCFPNRQ